MCVNIITRLNVVSLIETYVFKLINIYLSLKK